MPPDDARRGRLTAQFDQAQAEGAALAADPQVATAVERWMTATQDAARTLLQAGVTRDALMGAMLGPIVDLIVEVRDA